MMSEFSKIDILSADMILISGKVVTVDQEDTISEAVAIKNGLILHMGTNEEVKSLKGPKTEVIDLNGKLVLPGFIDTHEHCIRRGLQSDWVDCRSPPIQSINEVVHALSEKAVEKPEGEWVIGTWFDETKWEDKSFPTRYNLDKASTQHPIYLGRAGGHNAVANSLALKLAGINRNTPQPPGGHIEIDDSGEPTGRLDEIAAMNLVKNKTPSPSKEESINLMIANWPDIEMMLLSWGITTFHEAHIQAPEALAYQELLKQGNLQIRVGLMLDGMAPYQGHAADDLSRQGLRTGFGWNEYLYVVGVKLGTDGAMGSLTAALHEDYTNDPGNKGIIRVIQDELTDETIRCHKAGLRVCIHAIGDRAVDMTLSALEAAITSKEWPDHRHRIEHAGYILPQQLKKMAELGIAISASIGFCYPIGDSHIDALGPSRLNGYYPMRSFMEHDIVAAGNSDGFGTSWALTGIYGCHTRKSSSGRYIGERESISIMDSIRAYTINAAYLEGNEDIKGSIESGKLADIIVLNRDITSIDPEEILKTNVLMTFVNGKLVYNCSTN